MKRIYLSILTILAALSLSAQTATKLSATKANEYGLGYSLPLTVLDISIEAEFAELQPGQFANYAKRYLNIDEAITEPAYEAAVSSVVVNARGVEDPSNRWMMQLKGTQNAFVMLDEQGIPLAINSEKVPKIQIKDIPSAKAAQPTALETDAARQAITQEMSMSTSESKKAKLAADRIFELRETRNELISGQAENIPPDGESMKLALDNLTAQENALTAMFAGTEKNWTDVITVSYTPQNQNIKNKVIARLSPVDGFVDADDLSGLPIYLSVEIVTQGKLPRDEKGQEIPFPKNGVAYQIPGSALITITYEGRTLFSEKIELAQLGFPYGLDPKYFTDKKTVTRVIFDPATGAIRSLVSSPQ